MDKSNITLDRTVPHSRNCIQCTKQFTTYLSRVIYCSRQCYLQSKHYESAFTTSCAHCGMPIIRQKCHTRTNKTGKFYCSKKCHDLARMINFKGISDPIVNARFESFLATISNRATYKYYRMRVMAMSRIDPSVKCINCGCDDFRVLEINHKNGGGNRELVSNYSTAKARFYTDIALGTRAIDDLEIRCKLCNVLHYLKDIKGIEGFSIVYNRPIS